MTGRDGSNEVRVDDPALQQVQCPRIEVVPQSLIDEVPSGIAQSGRRESRFARDPLMAEVVHGEAHALIPHPGPLVDLVQQHGDERRLPIVAMDDLRALAGLEHELERRLAEEREPFDVVPGAVQVPAVKEAVV